MIQFHPPSALGGGIEQMFTLVYLLAVAVIGAIIALIVCHIPSRTLATNTFMSAIIGGAVLFLLVAPVVMPLFTGHLQPYVLDFGVYLMALGTTLILYRPRFDRS